MSNIVEIRRKQEEVLERLQRESTEIIEKRGLLKFKEKMAVTRVGYDDIGSILEKLDYTYTLITDHSISDYDILKEYNILFINCDTGGNAVANKESLRKFVQKGGVLYVSDLSAPQISTAFPNFIQFSSGGVADQLITVNVVDQDLQKIIGPRIEIYFDLPDWVPIEGVFDDVHTYLTGSFKTYNGYKRNKPILVSFRYGSGEVIYTSFHNHKQTTENEEKLLKFLVLKPVSTISRIPILRLARSKGLIALEQKDTPTFLQDSPPG